MAVGRVERNPSEHHDVGIAVEHVVEEVASGGRLPGHPRDPPVEGVEVRVGEEQDEREAQEARAAEEERDARAHGAEEGDP